MAQKVAMAHLENSPVGNTKKVYRARYWLFTWNNYPDTWSGTLLEKFKEMNSVKHVMQEETGESGTKHIQGYVAFKNPTRLGHLKSIDNAIHWEATRSKAAIEYCRKSASRTGIQLEGSLTSDTANYNGEDLITDEQLFDWQIDIKNLLATKPDKRKIYWYWESQGCAGKSSFAKYLAFHNENVSLTTCTKTADILTGVDTKYNAYIFDFPRCIEDFAPYNALEQLKNGFITDAKLKKKIRQVMFAPPHVIVFANKAPDTTKMSSDRWVICQIRSIPPESAFPMPIPPGQAPACVNADPIARLPVTREDNVFN